LRLVLAAGPALFWLLAPSVRSASTREFVESLLVYAAFCLFSLLLLACGRTVLRYALQVGGLVDGAWIVWVFHIDGGMHGDAPYLLLIQITGVTLLSSFRSGTKVALWDALLLFSLAQAETARVFGSQREVNIATVIPFLAFLVAVALLVANFAALNERELRRRRSDVEVLHRLAGDLEKSTDIRAVADRVCELACDDLDAERALLVVAPDPRRPDETAAPTLAWLRTSDGRTFAAKALEIPLGAWVMDAVEEGRARRELWIGGPPDPLIGSYLQGCVRALLIPIWLEAGSIGVVVLDYTHGTSYLQRLAERLVRAGSQSRWSRVVASVVGAWVARTPTWKLAKHRKLETRQIATAEQACAHGALALDRASMIAKLYHNAAFDPLTGLANRRVLDSMLKDLAASGQQYCVAILDLDHFKVLNDTWGHDAGDAALVNVADVMRASVRPADTPGRFGGEEFLLVMPKLDESQAFELADQLRSRIEQMPDLRLTVSIGVAMTGPGNMNHQSVVKMADQALYVAKASGRNQVVSHSQILGSASSDQPSYVRNLPATRPA
jgi:diguanylate cyclase (GGDEF)-like protein